MLIDDVTISPVPFVRDLGIYIGVDLSMRTHVQRAVSRCFAALRQLRQIRRSVPITTFQNARGCAGALPTGLRKWCAGRPPSTSNVPPPVGPECVGTADLQLEALRPHL